MNKGGKTAHSISSYRIRKQIVEVLYKIFRMVLLFGLCFLIVQPLLDKISVSFMEPQDLFDATVISIPRHVTLQNYAIAGNLLTYWPSLFKTLGILVVSAVLQITACTLTAYGFARFKFPLKNVLFLCVMLMIIVPPQTIMSSLYLNFHFFDFFGIFRLVMGHPVNMINSVFGFWMLSATGMGLKSGLYIFILRQYFRNVPKELEEAAYVDGCSKLYTFGRIMLPDAAPMLTSCFLFSFVWQWTDSIYTSLFLRNYDMLSNKLTRLSETFSRWWGATQGAAGASGVSTIAPVGQVQMMIATGMLMCLVPLILLYLVAQRAFVESLSQTGIKM